MNETEAKKIIAATQDVGSSALGRVFGFPEVEELPGMNFRIGEIFGSSDIGVDIGEKGYTGYVGSNCLERVKDAVGTDITFHTFKYMGISREITAMRFSYNESGGTSGGCIESLEGENLTIPGYDVSLGSRIALIDGADYQFVAGIETERVFVDGWLKEGEELKFRVSVPREEDVSFYVGKVLADQAKLLIF